ncbi:tetratricopeptide repeat protein, partial [bacterium]|nr:tetratricopeptide repeat protein [bacterium]
MAESASSKLQKYLNMVKLHPEDAEAHFSLGCEYQIMPGTGGIGEAMRCFNQVLKINPRHARAYFHRGMVYAKSGELRMALEDWKHTHNLDPDILNILSEPEHSNFYKDEIAKCLGQFSQQVALRPNDGFAHYQLGCANRYLGKPEIALQSLNKAIDINPRLWEANEQAGIIYYGLGRYKLAVINLRKVVEENPRYAEAHYLLGLAYDKENQTQLALKQFDEASMLDPKETKYLFASGKLNMKNSRHKQAMAKFQKILNIDPNSAEGYLYLARCCKEMFRPDLAM